MRAVDYRLLDRFRRCIERLLRDSVMSADTDPDAESESGDPLDIGKDAEFYECEDGSLASDDDSFYDSCDVNDEWSGIPDLRPRAQDNNFPPPLRDYKPRGSSEHPTIGFNEGREIVWAQCMLEVNLLREHVCPESGFILLMFHGIHPIEDSEADKLLRL